MPTVVHLLQGPDPVFVVIDDFNDLSARVGAGTMLHTLLNGPETRRNRLKLVSNDPRLELPAAQAAAFGPFSLRFEQVRRFEQRGETFVIEPQAGRTATVLVTSESVPAQSLHFVNRSKAGKTPTESRSLAPLNAVTVTISN